MKKYLFIILGASAIMACSKEIDLSDADDIVGEDGTYAITAYLEDATKASINGSTGNFMWTGDEQIKIWDSAHSEYVLFSIASYSNEGNKEARFTTTTAKTGATFNDNGAYYPASIAKTDGTQGYDFPTSYSSLTAAAKGFPMSGTVSGNEIKFSHLGSMIDVTLKNVPSFTKKLVLNAGETTINVTATPTDNAIHAVVPVPAGTYVLTVNLEDDQTPTANTFYTKPRASQTYTARNYYPINDITLGRLLTFTNDAGWDAPKVHIWNTNNTSQNADITTGGAFPNKLFINKEGKYYALMDNRLGTEWVKDGYPIGVQFVSTTNSSNTTQTSCVYLFRNIDFTIPAGGGIKTNYRVYPYKSGSNTSVTMSMIPVIVAKTSNTHDPAKIYIWNSGQSAHNTEWSTQKTMTWIKNEGDYKYWYYSFEENTPSVDFNCIITNNGSDTGKTGDLSVHFASKKYAFIDNGTVKNESTITSSKDVSLSTTKSASNYFELPVDVYGCIVLIKLGSTYWSVQIDRDFDYGY